MGPVLPSLLLHARALRFSSVLGVLSIAACATSHGTPRDDLATAGTALPSEVAIEATAGDEVATDAVAADASLAAEVSGAAAPEEPLVVVAVEVLEDPTVDATGDSAAAVSTPSIEDHEDAHRSELRAWLAFQRAEDARHASFDGLVIDAQTLEDLVVEVRSTLRFASTLEGDYRRAMGADRTRVIAGFVHAGRVWERVAGAFLAYTPSSIPAAPAIPHGDGLFTLLDDGSAPPWAPPGGAPHPVTDGARPMLDEQSRWAECRAVVNYLLATRAARRIVRPNTLTIALAQEARERLATYPEHQITRCMEDERGYEPAFEPYLPGELDEEPSPERG